MPEEEMVETPIEEGWEIDYKALYEKSQADVEKWKSRFKSAKAQEKEKAQFEIDDSYIDKKVEEKLFFQNNPTAREVEKEIREIQSKYTGMNVNDAFDLYLAKNKPELLWQKPSNTGVDGITKDIEPEKSWKEMNDQEFNEWWKARGKK
jgi:hypothetical protein